MVPLQEFKDSLGDEANKLSEEQILKLRDQMEKMATIFFDMWIKERNKE